MTALVNISPALIGMVELRGMITFIKPPKVSMPERERRDIEQHDVLHRAGKNARLDGRAERDGFVGILRSVRLAPKDFRHELPHERHARLAADQDHFVEVCGVEFRIGQRAQAMRAGSFDDRPRDRLPARRA